MKSSRCSNSASVSPGKPAMKVLRTTISGQISRQRAAARGSSRRSPAASCAAARRGANAGTARRGRAGSRPLAISGSDLVDVRVRVDVVQPHPGAVRLGDLARAARTARACASSPAGRPRSRCGSLHVDAVGAGVLADDEQLLDAGLEQRRASASTSPTGRDTRSPRRLGMMQKVQRWLQPSLIFR